MATPDPAALCAGCVPQDGAVLDIAHIASSSRIAAASRAESSGYAGSLPTSVVMRHERAHFLPSARAGTTVMPVTSGSVKAPAGAGLLTILMAEVMQTSAMSTPESAAPRSPSVTCTIG